MDITEEEVLEKYPWARELPPFVTDKKPRVCPTLELLARVKC